MRQRRTDSKDREAAAAGSSEEAQKEIQALRREIERLRPLVPPGDRHPKLLVLDVNGLLVHRVFLDGGGGHAHPRLSPAWTYGQFAVFERPHARGFLQFCLSSFTVGVWSTAGMGNLMPLLDRLLGQALLPQLAFIWDSKRCTFNGETDPSKPGKPIAFKELSRLWELRELAGLYGPDNTLLIDDSEYKARLNPCHTAIHPPAWEDPEAQAQDDSLGPQGKLRLYLSSLRSAPSVPAFVQTNPYDSYPHPTRLPTHPPHPTVMRVGDLEGQQQQLQQPQQQQQQQQPQQQQQQPQQQHEEEEEEEFEEEDEIVLTVASSLKRAL